jgi:hypothetical protein
MTSYINIHLQLTKEVLQAIGKDIYYISRYKLSEAIVSEIYANVQKEALCGKTRFIYKICHNFPPDQQQENIADLMKKLQAEFTSCKIEYVETKGYDGKNPKAVARSPTFQVRLSKCHGFGYCSQNVLCHFPEGRKCISIAIFFWIEWLC